MSYITGNTIRTLREKSRITQKKLAEMICISDKAVSKWETGKGLPDIGIIEDLAKALRVSLPELLTGDLKTNENVSANMKKNTILYLPYLRKCYYSCGRRTFFLLRNHITRTRTRING